VSDADDQLLKQNHPTIRLVEGFVTDPDQLLTEIRHEVVWDERMKSRKTASFGVSYDYSGMTYAEQPMPGCLQVLCGKIQNLLGFLPNNCLLNAYHDGQSTMGYHSDSTEQLLANTGVAIISLGAERYISYRSKADKNHRVRYLLKHGGLLYMDDQVQRDWMHAIPKSSASGERISLTFRHIIN
jgi:alkylated DNA repair dioxygenase AlkB